MTFSTQAKQLFEAYVVPQNHKQSDYFSLIRQLVQKRTEEGGEWQQYINQAYELLMDEIVSNQSDPIARVKFGTSGWRGKLGKDVFVRSARLVTLGIVAMYQEADSDADLARLLGIISSDEAKTKGAVIGFDNRFGGETIAAAVVDVLRSEGFTVHYAGESTTGVLSAAVLELGAAFSINLTPSHNPLEYGGFKFNAADAGPAEPKVTNSITTHALELFSTGSDRLEKPYIPASILERDDINRITSLQLWIDMVRKNCDVHGLDYDAIIDGFESNPEMVAVIDSVHGASRLHVAGLFKNSSSKRLIHLRANSDVTFGGIAPEPSSVNMQSVTDTLKSRGEKLKLGAIIDPDGDRIRFTDGTTEISMNQFGAMVYHFLHTAKKKTGMVAKTVATSNMANAVAKGLGEEVFEPKVGFKEFKPVIGKALVYFEESDGISVVGHTPEKDAYIGLLAALDMVLTLNMNLGDYKKQLEEEFGAFYPDRDGIEVSLKGDALLEKLNLLNCYDVGSSVQVGDQAKTIKEVITIDGRKMIFEDDSWLMVRPSGTEPKVRFYVESRDPAGTGALVETAKKMLTEIGVLS